MNAVMKKPRGKGLKIGYQATPTLALFHASEAFCRGVMGPVGSGKSTAMCMEIMRRAQEQAPGADKVRRTRFAVIRNTFRELKDTALATWLDWFPESAFGAVHRTDMRHMIRFSGPKGPVELEVLFRALDRPDDVRRLLSLELTGAWINEARELPKAVVDTLGDRVGRFPSARDGGCTWSGVFMDTNPPDQDHWWFRLAEEKCPRGWEFFRQPGGLIRTGDGFSANPKAENLSNLPSRYYINRMEGKSDEYIKVYYCSEYGFVMDGRPVFPEYSDSMHCAPRDLAPHPGTTVHVGLDFGLTPAALAAQRLPDGSWLWLDELVAEDMGITRFAELLKPWLNQRFSGLEVCLWGDPAGRQRAQTDGRTVFGVLAALGLTTRSAPSNDFTLRREAVAAPMARLVDGRPAFAVSPRCLTARKGLSGGYCLRRVAVAGEERFRDLPDKTRFSHVVDAGGYAMLGAGEGRVLTAPRRRSPRQSLADCGISPAAPVPSTRRFT